MKHPTSALVIESSKTFSMYLHLLLQRMGLKALRVSEPDAAKTVLERGFTDVVIVGDQEGTQRLHTVVKTLIGYMSDNPIPIIAVSKQDNPFERRACYEAGCQAFLLKPVKPKELQDALYARVSPEAERRKNLRSKLDISAEGSINQQEMESLRILSLSSGGALVGYGTAVTIGTEVFLNFPLNDRVLNLAGKVIYNLANYDGKGMHAFGMVFQDVPQNKKDLINQSLERMLEQELLSPESPQ